MRTKLVLSLTGAHLRLEALPPESAGVAGRLRAMLTGKKLEPVELPVQVACVELAGVVTHDTLSTQLEKALADLKSKSLLSLDKCTLEARLGLDHARIGLMVLEGGSAAALTPAARETYVQAWIRQMLHLEPETQVIRWQVLADPHKILVSCVDRRIFEVVSEFAIAHDFRFASCRPAVLSTTFSEADAVQASTVIWTEAGIDAPRSGSVQLLRMEGSQVSAAWRGWVPFLDEKDEALQGAIRRFQTDHRTPGAEPLKRIHWPVAGADHVRS